MIRLLGALLGSAGNSLYGLELAKASGLSSGTIYPALARLERIGWVSSAWEEIDPSVEGRPRRRLYTMTGHGSHAARAALEELATELDGLRLRGDWSPRPGVQPA